MNAWYRQIRIGDRCRLEATAWRVAGSVACLLPDGTFWQEWRLMAEPPASGERWLAWKEDVGAVLWRPVQWPAQAVAGELDSLQRFEHDGRVFRRMLRDSYRIARIEGDVNAASRPDEQVEYAEYLAGTQRFALEWNARGQTAFAGEKLSPQAALEGFQGTAAAQAVRARPLARSKSGQNDEGESVTSIITAVACLLVMLLSFWWESSIDCNARTNPQTGQIEYACSDGTVRNSRPWNGK